ncbi:hypothetical protein GCM10010513_23390 [Streptomyces glebosus]|nr:hypothetical protein GCM10010513_23390 [Streptomyces glebosus]
MPLVRGVRSPGAVLRAVALVIVVAGAALLLGGCQEGDAPRSAGPATALTAPQRLWPDRKAVPPPSPATSGEETPQSLNEGAPEQLRDLIVVSLQLRGR